MICSPSVCGFAGGRKQESLVSAATSRWVGGRVSRGASQATNDNAAAKQPRLRGGATVCLTLFCRESVKISPLARLHSPARRVVVLLGLVLFPPSFRSEVAVRRHL